MLVQTIPAYRLPRRMLDREMRMIESWAWRSSTGMRLGKDFTLKRLRDKGYEAVFLGVGAPKAQSSAFRAKMTAGVVDAMQFLREYNLRRISAGRQTAWRSSAAATRRSTWRGRRSGSARTA